MIGSAAGSPPAVRDAAAAHLAVRRSTFPLPRRVVAASHTATKRQRTSAGARFPQFFAESAIAATEPRNPRKSRSTGDGTGASAPKAAATTKPWRVFLLDVNPICYDGARPNLYSFVRWLSLFFSQVSLRDPVIAVLDGESGNDYRRQLLPSYKAHRRRFSVGGPQRAEQLVSDVLQNCHVPVVKVSGYEADDVVATLADQILQRGLRVVIASPDKDFKQLISEDVQIVMPMPEFGRWSFYTLKHYVAQYNCDPSSDLSLRCILGDEVDGVPGIQHLVPGFGRKTAVKLLKKHGSLENLLNAAAIKTVGKQYAQEALTKYGDYLRKNHEVLSLRRDADVHIEKNGYLRETPAMTLPFYQTLSKCWMKSRSVMRDNRHFSENSNGPYPFGHLQPCLSGQSSIMQDLLFELDRSWHLHNISQRFMTMKSRFAV